MALMMDHAQYELNDFLQDDCFVDWVTGGHQADFWEDFLLHYPDKQPVLEQARALILAAATLPTVAPDAQQIRQMWAQIEPVVQQPTPVRRLPGWSYWAAAASVVLLLVGVVWYQQQRPRTISYQQRTRQSAVPLQEITNETTQPQRFQLADGSSVRLEPGSSLSFPKSFRQLARREVYLAGSAFFEVTKNPAQPFLVYTDELITKVLGTSFFVRTNEKRRQITVDVHTGRVSVFAQADPQRSQRTASTEIDGTVLTPNQQATFDRSSQQLAKSLVPQPALLPDAKASPVFEYDNTPAPVIFRAIEQAYGVEIVYDEALLKDCRLTASLTNESLLDKIQLLCQGLDARYEVIDAKIVISANGCSPNP